MTGRILAVDPGELRLGLAVSDELGMIARPLLTIRHTTAEEDARQIVEQAEALSSRLIIIGVALNQEGLATPQSEKAMRLIERLQRLTSVPIIPYDESGTTQRALELGGNDNQLDQRAAAVLLQDYLDAQAP